METKRNRTGANLWWQAHKWIRLTGDYGISDRIGEMSQLFETGTFGNLTSVDFKDAYYGAGVKFHRNRTTANFEFRGSTFKDKETSLDDRTTSRFHGTFATHLPQYKNLSFNGGYQYYRLTVTDRSYTLTANTAWVGTRLFPKQGFTFGYNLMFDRAFRTGDLVDTDNITHALSAGKIWRGKGGLKLGYRYRANDDVLVKRTGSSLSTSAWFKPIASVLIRAGHGITNLDVDEGRTLTGRRNLDRAWASARYTFEDGWVRIKAVAHNTEYEDLETSAKYVKGAFDLSYDVLGYAQFNGAYSYYKGDYSNCGGRFLFADHSLSGDITTRKYMNTQIGFGGT